MSQKCSICVRSRAFPRHVVETGDLPSRAVMRSFWSVARVQTAVLKRMLVLKSELTEQLLARQGRNVLGRPPRSRKFLRSLLPDR